MRPEDLSGNPLSQFQMTAANVDDTRKLVRAINAAVEANGLSASELDRKFEIYWSELDKKLEEIRTSVSLSVFTADHAQERPVYRDRALVLIVDDELSHRTTLAEMVHARGMTADTASDGNEALAKLDAASFDVIVTDINMPGMDGFGFLQRLKENCAENSADMPPAIVLTAYGNTETAVRTVYDLGAYWYLEKPVHAHALEVLLHRASAHGRMLVERRNLERQLTYKGALGELVGVSAKMQEIFALLRWAGPSKAPVLITGERGTARKRWPAPFTH
jgi:CheY-like chemotaxis protein